MFPSASVILRSMLSSIFLSALPRFPFGIPRIAFSSRFDPVVVHSCGFDLFLGWIFVAWACPDFFPLLSCSAAFVAGTSWFFRYFSPSAVVCFSSFLAMGFFYFSFYVCSSFLFDFCFDSAIWLCSAISVSLNVTWNRVSSMTVGGSFPSRNCARMISFSCGSVSF